MTTPYTVHTEESMSALALGHMASLLRGGNVAKFNEVRPLSLDLQGADLQGIDLTDANFSRTNLEGVNLSNANLSNADLRYANLTGANLDRAVLVGVTLWGCKGLPLELREAYIDQLRRSWVA